MTFLNKLYLYISFVLLGGSILLDVLIWLRLVAKEEPQLVLHLSTGALIIGAFGNIISSVVNKKVDEN